MLIFHIFPDPGRPDLHVKARYRSQGRILVPVFPVLKQQCAGPAGVSVTGGSFGHFTVQYQGEERLLMMVPVNMARPITDLPETNISRLHKMDRIAVVIAYNETVHELRIFKNEV
jgi:hypothetical protein